VGRTGRWGEGERVRRGEEEAALPRWGASGLAWRKLQRAAAVQGFGGFGVTAPGYRVGDWVGAEVAHPVADDVIGAFAEFFGFQASEGIVVEDAAELLIREEDEVDVEGGVVNGGSGHGGSG
jgi:hypothetical protein